MDKLLEDMEQKIKEVRELLATFKKLQLDLEPLKMPTLERCGIPDEPPSVEPKKRGRKKKELS